MSKLKMWALLTFLGLLVVAFTASLSVALELDQRDMVSYLRGPYNIAFFHRHNSAFRISSAIHFAHAKQHDILELTPQAMSREADVESDVEYLHCLYNPPRTEPTMEYFGPYMAKSIFNLYRAIDWTHMHHEQTYDILSERSIPWDSKKEWTDRAVDYYLNRFDIPRSPAPLDVTMRRAAVMMKPYFTLFRNYYPRSNNFFYAAHWWHPVIYEAMMMGGNDAEQETMVRETDATYYSQVLEKRPLRMLLSRESMPRYSRMSPESANIFDNLHMLHGIAYDILAYEGWTMEQKKAEMERVIRAMSYQPGDEELAAKFDLPYPDMDPRVYYDWMQGSDGAMTRMMREMLNEMMPHMSPDGMDERMSKKVFEQFAMKMRPGIEDGEIEGSLHDALKELMPQMKMSPQSMEPGVTDPRMVEMMLQGWREKYGNSPDVEPIAMDTDPTPPPFPQEALQRGWRPLEIQDVTP